MKQDKKTFLPVVVFFIVLNALFITLGRTLRANGFDTDVLIIGNALLFLISLISFLIVSRGVNNPNPHAFLRSVNGSVMIKLFLCVIAAFIYIATYKKGLNKPALFTCMALYLVYTALEVTGLMKMLKKKSHG